MWCERLTETELKTTLECPLIGNGDSVIIKKRYGSAVLSCKQGGTAVFIVP
jgi:transcription elongation factor Elf1